MPDRYCIVVPHYNHVAQLRRFLPRLVRAQLPILVFDDGSETAQHQALTELAAGEPLAQLDGHEPNQGKGAAMIAAMRAAAAQGFTHAIIVDADGQHDSTDIERLHQASLASPRTLFSGDPQFGPDIPLARRYGRTITNTLARIAAGDGQIRDAMCGLRLYPLSQVLPLFDDMGSRVRMQVDTELLVRACWAGARLRYLPTRVVYPDDGASHFRMLRDNINLAAMHLRLVSGGLWRRLRGGPERRRDAQPERLS
ncbi:MAG: glycosyltransferase family 2 protein [Pseudomonadota bacterium]